MQTVKRRCAQTARISLHLSKMSKSVSSEKNRTSRQFPSVTSSASSSDFPNLGVCSCICVRPSPSLFRFGEAVSTEPRKRPQEGNEGMSPFFCCTCFSTQNLGVEVMPTTRNAAPQHDFSALRHSGGVASSVIHRLRPSQTGAGGPSKPAAQAGSRLRRDRAMVQPAKPFQS